MKTNRISIENMSYDINHYFDRVGTDIFGNDEERYEIIKGVFIDGVFDEYEYDLITDTVFLNMSFHLDVPQLNKLENVEFQIKLNVLGFSHLVNGRKDNNFIGSTLIPCIENKLIEEAEKLL